MDIDVICFSPTGSTRTYVDAIAREITSNVRFFDITLPENRKTSVSDWGDVVIWAFPIYGGRIPKIALDHFGTLRGNNTPLVIVAVYGNVSTGIAMRQTAELATKQNFRLFSAGSFVAEHTYANSDINVGNGRPDEADMVFAKNFGCAVLEKWNSDDRKSPVIKNSISSRVIKRVPYSRKKLPVVKPVIDSEKCTRCFVCSAVCPANAISIDDLEIDVKKCIQCYACSKKCPNGARTRGFKSPFVGKIFFKMGKKTKNNKIYT